MLRKFFLYAYISITSLIAYSQSIDEKIVNAINCADWFSLDSIYNSSPKDSIHPYLEISARCFIGHQLNRPDVSIPAFKELYNTQSDYLDLNNFISFAVMFGKDLSKVGENEFAASMINQTMDATRQYLDSAMVSDLTFQANWYSALGAYNPYQIQFNGDSIGKVPFAITPAGPKEKGNVLMHLKESTINGLPADIIFDTGAGHNVISPEMAEKFGLIPLDRTRISVSGVGQSKGYLAIAKELQIGNITVMDVPFTVVPITSNNSEADSYADEIKILMGLDFMLQLKDITIDFETNNLTIPAKDPFIPVKTDAKPNMCLTSTKTLLSKATILNNPMLMYIDTGNTSYGDIGETFFENNKQYVLDNGIKDTVRIAGIGGIKLNDRYKLSNIKISLGGHTLEIPEIDVRTTQEEGIGSQYEGILGLRSLMLYPSIHFNFVDFVLTTGLPRNINPR